MIRGFLVLALVLSISITPAFGNEYGLKVGQQAPLFSALSYQGKDVQLNDYLKRGPVVLIFYRGGWCPYCNLQLKEYQKYFKQFKEADATIIAVSVDKQTQAFKTVQEQELGFEVISNPDAGLLERYNLVFKVPDELEEVYRTKYAIDLEAYSGRNDHIIAVASTFVIAPNGKIVFAYASEDYKVRPKAVDILKIVQRLP